MGKRNITPEKRTAGAKAIKFVSNELRNDSSRLAFYKKPNPTFILGPVFRSSSTRFWMYDLVREYESGASYELVEKSGTMDKNSIREIFNLCKQAHISKQKIS